MPQDQRAQPDRTAQPTAGEYRTVAGEGVHETEISRSRFLCHLAPAATEAAAREFIARIRAEHPAASHNCAAYVIGADAGVQRADDDGEPGGTAGVPMLQMLLRREIRYAVAVVTRYFGGTKLGAGGLIRAYGGAVGEALDAVGTVRRRPFRLVTVTVGHERAGRLENDLRARGHDVRDAHYGAEVAFEVGLPATELDAFRAWLADATAGTARLELGGASWLPETGTV
ncbi:YigZ family protein [Streptomyces boncukensis]|uniref:YigZ family protein n=1 Tax=Streptomyces boncukensis TaxID=2711219 RepID=A0A6G4WV67_9ACTN|nr:YigZ family protein [Streptomyces boncukensis]NGO68361.1 YigZ family protein [Streptomyces boncukensis]